MGWRSTAPPLCPAGHLPTRGKISRHQRPWPIFGVARREPVSKLAISPLVGEMSGRTEGGP
ncbi:MAG: lytic murein transglycosylase [Mesorhizobium sp.]|nr:MAG: lytic murein transglycosylase [Mesorhizobium sp.]